MGLSRGFRKDPMVFGALSRAVVSRRLLGTETPLRVHAHRAAVSKGVGRLDVRALPVALLVASLANLHANGVTRQDAGALVRVGECDPVAVGAVRRHGGLVAGGAYLGRVPRLVEGRAQVDDPELRRAVALKLLRPELDEAEGRRRLAREAQAMARLSHPNVISVHDVGVLGDDVFITMELVAGGTAKDFTGPGTRSASDVLALYIGAGRGLAHAHAAGIVHRDFKPANVFVDVDGRARVADFGLAREGPRPELEEGTVLPAGDARVTQTGTVLGTPAFLAPEVRAGQPSDAKSDQFSFCLALHEGLCGELPLAGASAAEPARAIAALRIRAQPKRTRIPPHVRRAVLRGLSPDPQDRFPTMDALLSELSYRPGRTRRRLLVVAVSTVALAATAFGVIRERERRASLCEGGDAKLEDIWGAPHRQGMQDAFAASGLPDPEDAAKRARHHLDALGQRFKSAHREACLATRVRGVQSEELLDLRMMCLERWRQQAGATIDLLVKADQSVARRSMEMLFALPSLESCADVELLTVPIRPPESKEARARLGQHAKELAACRALLAAGRWPEALARTQKLLEAATTLRYRPFEAEVQFVLGTIQQLLGTGKDAEASVRSAINIATAVGDDALAANAWSHAAGLAAKADRPSEAESAAGQALALLERLGNSPELEIKVMNNLGVMHLAMLDLEPARAHLERGLAACERITPRPEATAEVLTRNLGRVLYSSGDLDEAVRQFERSWDMIVRLYGKNHPLMAGALVSIGNVRVRQRRAAEALPLLERALAIFEAALGPLNPQLAMTLGALAEAHLELGQAEAALPYAERAFALVEGKTMRSAFPAEVRFIYARATWELGRDRARALAMPRGFSCGWRVSRPGPSTDRRVACRAGALIDTRLPQGTTACGLRRRTQRNTPAAPAPARRSSSSASARGYPVLAEG